MAVTPVSTSLPEVILAPGTTITVSVDVAGAKVTKLNVYGFSPVRQEPIDASDVIPPFVYATPT